MVVIAGLTANATPGQRERKVAFTDAMSRPMLAGVIVASFASSECTRSPAHAFAGETLTTFSFAAGSWTAGNSLVPYTAGTGAGAVNITFTIGGPDVANRVAGSQPPVARQHGQLALD